VDYQTTAKALISHQPRMNLDRSIDPDGDGVFELTFDRSSDMKLTPTEFIPVLIDSNHAAIDHVDVACGNSPLKKEASESRVLSLLPCLLFSLPSIDRAASKAIVY
jgi:hypothetical protein